MQQIKLTRGLDLPMDGAAEKVLKLAPQPKAIQVVPDHFAGVTPKLVVKAGEVVKAGSPLFYDKAFESMMFVSPVSGKVTEIVRGDRRKVLSINIEADDQMQYVEFDTKQDAKSLLLQSGLWALLKQRPYDCIAMPTKSPKAVFVSSFDSAPLAPDYEFVLESQFKEVEAGIALLSQLAPVYVGVRAGSKFASLKGCTLFEVAGPHPAGNVGVQINAVAPMAKTDTVFCANIQDVAIIGRLALTGHVDMHKTVALTGPAAQERYYVNLLPGCSISSVLSPVCGARYVAGNALSGHQVELTEAVSPFDNQYTTLANGDDTHEFMGWLMPRFRSFNAGMTDPAGVLCRLFGKKHYEWDARLKGGRRAIIVSDEYDRVFPMDIYPEYLLKAMIAGNLDREIELGAMEVAPEDFALCEFVCTSKMPLQAIVRAALDNLKKEIE